ncbi:4-alpha-glucanotransferase [Sinomonas cellulolyticus]|uniref:4-alpha-glucanotransferase n=1 Tax=Sinomonas cellulolyticus TaxID=2801916 RepID=A0ABS1K6P0_9MICC|nr:MULTISPECIES: 4-alpha-glucanotransferase [Sinomonas]MBL0707311.1 4-alpha-glucanotransferase [Sinomonas cellulolyticus]GHG50603.1 4-alpha-glucanotransferase [Sinomonas sp. KCTC 49339]
MADAEELLRELARRHGVATWFWGWGGSRQEVGAGTLRSVLGALGVPTDTPEAMRQALQDSELAPWRRLLPAVTVVREGADAQVLAHVPHGSRVSVWVVAEDGREHPARQVENHDEARTVDGVLTGRAAFLLPQDLPLGWHTLHARGDGLAAEAPLVVTPQALSTTGRLEDSQRWGLMAQLYSVRSQRSWGVGDLGDLADLAAVGAEQGADFVLVNPLHAAEPKPPLEDSPYLPTTRRFVNPLYLRVEDIAEFAYLPPAERSRVEELGRALQPANSSSELLDRDAAYAAKLEALDLVWRVPRSPAREHAYARFRAEAGRGLEDFARWCVLAAGREDGADFYRWLQWVCDEQLASAHRTALGAGMQIGLIHDLAVGVRPDGADGWALSDVLAAGVTVGAPPDMFNQQGQNWSQPPWHPQRLAESGYAAYRDMLRTILRHAGGIRVDHILGLFRLWWIPEGHAPGEGTYVHYDHEALVGILALEAQRAGAVVIGEDLGVFEPWVRDYLAERGILGTSILWFEYDGDRPLAPEAYRRACLTSVNTHDLPPTAGYLAGEHVRLRESLGLLERPVSEELEAARAEIDGVVGLLRERGLLPEGADLADEQRVIEALYRLITFTPSCLLGVALVDAVGERRTQNQPGTYREHPNWRIPLTDAEGAAVLIEELPDHERFASLLAAVRESLAQRAAGRQGGSTDE